MTGQLLFLLLYTIGLTLIGVWVGRLVRGPADFFVAGRRLSWPLLGATVLAANIGAGTTIGAAGLAYRDGISAWWWNGAAGIGSLILAFVVGPKLWEMASARGYFTVGDVLEDRYGASTRGIVAALIWIGTLAILAGQLIAGSAVLEVVAGLAKWQGVLIGGVAMTIYFTAGGLLSSAWVNAVQLVVLLAGFIVAVPVVLDQAGGLSSVMAPAGAPVTFGNPLHSIGAGSGWTLLLLLGPGFVSSPGLVQKAFGGASARAVAIGIGAAGIAQLIFSFAPVLLGMSARAIHPDIPARDLVLPTVLTHELPPALGALALAAVFSAEVSTCDAILFMLATSLSKDLYQRFVNPSASPDQVLRVARLAAILGGTLGMVLAMQIRTVVDALTIFYSLLGATLLVPLVGAIFVKRTGPPEAITSIVCGVGVLLAVQFGTDRSGWWNPNFWGLVASAVSYLVVLLLRRQP
ncbi:MAG: sodium:solute symporter family protein [Vicinamibacterales bacterium]